MSTKKVKLDFESPSESLSESLSESPEGVVLPTNKPWFEHIELVTPGVEARDEVVKPWHENIPEQVTPPEQKPSGKKPWQE
jgi:hypothetical protein